MKNTFNISTFSLDPHFICDFKGKLSSESIVFLKSLRRQVKIFFFSLSSLHKTATKKFYQNEPFSSLNARDEWPFYSEDTGFGLMRNSF